MSSRAFLIALAIFEFAIAPALATNYIVGDDKGWALDIDQQAWATGKTFYVGDVLVFNYPKGAHNVHKVNGTQFKDCETTGSLALTSGNDVVVLQTPGRKWYICGVPGHCANRKMNLVIDVWPLAASPSPAPSTPATNPTSAADTIVSKSSLAWMISTSFFMAAIIIT